MFMFAAPLIVGVIGKTLYDANTSIKMDERARKKYERAYRIEMDAKNILDMKKHEIQQALKKTIDRKRSILEKTFPLFVSTYQQLRDFEMSDKDFFKNNNLPMLTNRTVQSIQDMAIVAQVPLTDAEEWSAVITGGLGKGMITESQRRLEAANATLEGAKTMLHVAENISESVEIIITMSNRIAENLAILNAFLLKSLKRANEIIVYYKVNNNWQSNDDITYLKTVFNNAKTLHDIIKSPIVGSDEPSILEIQHSISKAENFRNKLVNNM